MRFMAGDEWHLLLTGSRENWNRFLFTAKPGEMKFVGTWRVTSEEPGRFAPGHFSVERVDDGSDRALLHRLQPALAGSGWERKAGSSAAKAANVADAKKPTSGGKQQSSLP
jgi:hypothetical protein